MSKVNDFLINKILGQIKENYMTPKYNAEISIDTILSIFLEGIINQYLFNINQYNEKLTLISTEFPLKKRNNDQSKNIDFLYSTKNTLYLVELKTTTKSFNHKQFYDYLEVAKKIESEGSASFLIKDFHIIANKTKSTKKYYWLYEKKIKLGLFQVDSLQNINQVKIIYIAPTSMVAKQKKRDDRLIFISFHDLAQLTLMEQFAVKETSEAWDTLKSLFHEINQIDQAL